MEDGTGLLRFVMPRLASPCSYSSPNPQAAATAKSSRSRRFASSCAGSPAAGAPHSLALPCSWLPRQAPGCTCRCSGSASSGPALSGGSLHYQDIQIMQNNRWTPQPAPIAPKPHSLDRQTPTSSESLQCPLVIHTYHVFIYQALNLRNWYFVTSAAVSHSACHNSSSKSQSACLGLFASTSNQSLLPLL